MKKATSGIGGGVNRSRIGGGIGAGTGQLKKENQGPMYKPDFSATAGTAQMSVSHQLGFRQKGLEDGSQTP